MDLMLRQNLTKHIPNILTDSQPQFSGYSCQPFDSQIFGLEFEKNAKWTH